MHVLATAGHVDHGKSTLVRALTGTEPDRWAEERRRGMTIDLGYAWCTLPSGAVAGFVDVPGHERFVANTLAGLGPAPAVLVVVAADEGWRTQSAEHLAAIDALGVRHGLLVVTRSDLAAPEPALTDAAGRIARTSLGDVESVAVSGVTGAGLPDLRAALDRLVARLPPPDADAPVRLWVDRAFTVRGSGTVVTGTLTAGTLRTGDEVDVRGRTYRVRALHSLGVPYDTVTAVARVGINVRGLALDDVGRGDALVAAGTWPDMTTVDVRLPGGAAAREALLHVGAATTAVRVRPLGAAFARLTLVRPLPLRIGDRVVLRDPGTRRLTGATVLDVDPPALGRRGAAGRRAADLAAVPGSPDPRGELGRRGVLPARALPVASVPGARVVAGWAVTDERWSAWCSAVAAAAARGGTDADVAAAAGLPDPALVAPVAAAAGVVVRRGGDDPAVASLVRHLTAHAFDAPTSTELVARGLRPAALAAAARSGRLLLLGGDVVLRPVDVARAAVVLAGLPQPFTTSAARVALGASRRVAIALLEHLDARGVTVAHAGHLRSVVEHEVDNDGVHEAAAGPEVEPPPAR